MSAQIAVLAGGRGSRLGGSKALAKLGELTLVERAVAAALATGLPAFVMSKEGVSLPALDVPVRIEAPEPTHPLFGIAGALEEAAGGAIVALGCDLPFVTPAFLAWLAIQPEELVVPRVGSRVHGLIGRYSRSLLPALSAAAAREAPVAETLLDLDPRFVDAAELAQFGEPERILFNVNTPADLERAAGMLDDPGGERSGE